MRVISINVSLAVLIGIPVLLGVPDLYKTHWNIVIILKHALKEQAGSIVIVRARNVA